MQNKIRQRIELEKADCDKLINFIGDKEEQDELDKDDVTLLNEQILKYDQTHRKNMKQIRKLVALLKKQSEDKQRAIGIMYA